MILSILICTLPERAEKLKRLKPPIKGAVFI